MSRIYRAIWCDAGPTPDRPVTSHFAEWVGEKTAGALAVPQQSGSVTARVPDAGGHCVVEVAVEYASDDGDLPLRAELVETRGDGSRWETVLRTWSEDGVGTWTWVDVEAAGSERLHETPAAAPRLVRALLDSARDPRQGTTRLTTRALPAWGPEAGEELAEELSDPERTCPIAVFAKDPMLEHQLAEQAFGFEDITRRTAEQLAGLAAVRVADAAALQSLQEALGFPFAVWGGAVRLYLPGLDPAVPGDEGRHRVIPSGRYTRYRDLAAHALARAVGPPASTRRPPPSYEDLRAALRRRREAVHDYAELLRMADAEISRLSTHLAALERTAATQDEEMFDLQADLEEAVGRASTAEAMVERLWVELQADRGSATSPEAEPDLADLRPASCTEAARFAQERLRRRLVVPEAALRDLGKLDERPEAGAWGQTAWRGFLALDAYAAARAAGEAGDFYTWCQTSRHPRAWPATPKKLAMVESQSVTNDKRFRKHRILPAPTDGNPDRRLYMGAHLKIAQGGGPLAPRIYFHVDDALGKVYVGFFGPHAHMPNKQTN